MSDFRVIVTVKNNRLLRAMDANGLDTAVMLSRASRVAEKTIGAYLGLKLAPIRPDGEWRESALKISAVLRRLPEDLFPPEFLRVSLQTNRVEREVSAEQLPGLTGHGGSIAYDPGRALIVKDAVSALYDGLRTLRPREQTVIAMRFGLTGGEAHTLDEVSAKLRVSRERIRQIEAKALRKLRHPSRRLEERTDALREHDA